MQAKRAKNPHDARRQRTRYRMTHGVELVIACEYLGDVAPGTGVTPELVILPLTKAQRLGATQTETGLRAARYAIARIG